jgi:hypothetical protein
VKIVSNESRFTILKKIGREIREKQDLLWNFFVNEAY